MGESEGRTITVSPQRVTPKRHLKEQRRRLQALDGISLPITGSTAEAPALPKVQSRRARQGRPPDKSVEKRRKVMRKVPKESRWRISVRRSTKFA